MGAAKFTWAIAHGEGYCNNLVDGKRCCYPARAYHYDVGPIKRLVLILQYHPSGLLTKEQARAQLEVGPL
jgi:hypothetical protein